MSFDEYGAPIKKKRPISGYEEGIPVVQEPDPMPDVMAESVAKADTSPRSTRNVKDYATIYKADEYQQKAPKKEYVEFTDIKPSEDYTAAKPKKEYVEFTDMEAEKDYFSSKIPPALDLKTTPHVGLTEDEREEFGDISTIETQPIPKDWKIKYLAKRGGFEDTVTGKLLLDAKRIEDQGASGKIGAASARFTAGFASSGEAIIRPQTPDLWSLSGGLARRGIIKGAEGMGMGTEAREKLGSFGAEAAFQSRSNEFGVPFIVGGSAGEVVTSITAGKLLFTGFRAGKALIKMGKVGKIKSGFGKIKIPSILGKKPTIKTIKTTTTTTKPKKTADKIIGWGEGPKISKQFSSALGKTLGKRTTIKTTTTTTTRRIVKRTKKPKADDTFKEIRSSTGQVQLMKMKPQKQITKTKQESIRKLGMYGKAPEIKAKSATLKQVTKTKQTAKARQLGMYGKAPEIKPITKTIIKQKQKQITKPITITKTIAKQKQKQITKPITITKTMTKPITKTMTKPITKTMVKPITKTMVKPITKTMVKPITIAKPITVARPITAIKPITVARPITAIKPITVARPITTTKPRTVPKPPKTPPKTPPRTFPPIVPLFPFRLKGALGGTKKKKKGKKGKKFTRINIGLAKGLKI